MMRSSIVTSFSTAVKLLLMGIRSLSLCFSLSNRTVHTACCGHRKVAIVSVKLQFRFHNSCLRHWSAVQDYLTVHITDTTHTSIPAKTVFMDYDLLRSSSPSGHDRHKTIWNVYSNIFFRNPREPHPLCMIPCLHNYDIM